MDHASFRGFVSLESWTDLTAADFQRSTASKRFRENEANCQMPPTTKDHDQRPTASKRFRENEANCPTTSTTRIKTRDQQRRSDFAKTKPIAKMAVDVNFVCPQ
jgi:hypothetical protein